MTEVALHDTIARGIHTIRNRRVMLDHDLATLYGVTTSNLNKAVKRNTDRFPEDFMFQLSGEEYDALRFQSGILKRGEHSKYLPHAFTEQGVSMLSAVLSSPRAVQMSILIMRAFVRLREIVAESDGLRHAIERMEQRVGKNERDIHIALGALQKLLNPPDPAKSQRNIGFAP
jgi:hypothetical protein